MRHASLVIVYAPDGLNFDLFQNPRFLDPLIGIGGAITGLNIPLIDVPSDPSPEISSDVGLMETIPLQSGPSRMLVENFHEEIADRPQKKPRVVRFEN